MDEDEDQIVFTQEEPKPKKIKTQVVRSTVKITAKETSSKGKQQSVADYRNLSEDVQLEIVAVDENSEMEEVPSSVPDDLKKFPKFSKDFGDIEKQIYACTSLTELEASNQIKELEIFCAYKCRELKGHYDCKKKEIVKRNLCLVKLRSEHQDMMQRVSQGVCYSCCLCKCSEIDGALKKTDTGHKLCFDCYASFKSGCNLSCHK